MLYISRLVGQTKFGVVDTDDGVETIVTRKELVKIIAESGLEIKGCKCQMRWVHGKQVPQLVYAQPWQDSDQVTSIQLKMKMMKGIDITVYNGVITKMSVDTDIANSDIRIRLSDYGTSCGDGFLSSMPLAYKGKITLVLDDKITISQKSLKDFTMRAVIVDATEVENKTTIEYICRELSQAPQATINMGLYMVDRQERIDYYMGCALVNRPMGYMKNDISSVADLVSDSKRVNEIVAKKLRREFDNVANAEFKRVKSIQYALQGKRFIQWLSSRKHYVDIPDYDIYTSENFMNIFPAMREISMCNKSALTRFESYMHFFEVTPEIKKSFMTFCSRAGKWLLEVGKAEGIIL